MAKKKNNFWIEAARAKIKKAGTEGNCTGKKFGSKSCPVGSPHYKLAVTLKKIAKRRKKSS